jgi:hypothetical protein
MLACVLVRCGWCAVQQGMWPVQTRWSSASIDSERLVIVVVCVVDFSIWCCHAPSCHRQRERSPFVDLRPCDTPSHSSPIQTSRNAHPRTKSYSLRSHSPRRTRIRLLTQSTSTSFRSSVGLVRGRAKRTDFVDVNTDRFVVLAEDDARDVIGCVFGTDMRV